MENEILKKILDNQEKESRIVTEFINSQKLHNQKVNSLLLSDSDAGSIGLGQKIINLEKEVRELRTETKEYQASNNKKIAFFTGGGLALLSVGKWLITKLFV